MHISGKKGQNMATTDIIREQVRRTLHDNPGIKIGEIAATLGIALNTARKHVRVLRAEWVNPEAEE